MSEVEGEVKLRMGCAMHATQEEPYAPAVREGRRFLTKGGTAAVSWEAELLDNGVSTWDYVIITDGDSSVGFSDVAAVENLVSELEVFLRERKESTSTTKGD